MLPTLVQFVELCPGLSEAVENVVADKKMWQMYKETETDKKIYLKKEKPKVGAGSHNAIETVISDNKSLFQPLSD